MQLSFLRQNIVRCKTGSDKTPRIVITRIISVYRRYFEFIPLFLFRASPGSFFFGSTSTFAHGRRSPSSFFDVTHELFLTDD